MLWYFTLLTIPLIWIAYIYRLAFQCPTCKNFGLDECEDGEKLKCNKCGTEFGVDN